MSESEQIPDSAPTSESPTITDINEDYQIGDITLISADGMHFKVSSEILKIHSAIFRSMMDVGGSDKSSTGFIELTDLNYENSLVIKMFLNIAVQGVFPRLSTQGQVLTDTLPSFVNLVRFCDKYGCAQVTTFFKQWLQSTILRHSGNGLQVFIIAANMGDLSLCKISLNSASKTPFITDENAKDVARPRDLQRCSPRGKHVLQVTEWAFTYFNLCPITYLCALARATGCAVGSPAGAKEWGEVAEEFEKIMVASR